jgi:hypothetical protein
MSEQNKTKADNWIRSAVQALVIIVSTWQLFTKEIHGYIDTKLEGMEEQVVRKVATVNHGQMLLLVDSIGDVMQLYQDTTRDRLFNIEELIGVRPSNRTIVVPPDTVAIARLQKQMRDVEAGIEQILDGQAEAAGKRRLRRAHNAFPQE